VARLTIDNSDGLTALDVIHRRSHALPASSTVAEVREWFGDRSGRKLAFLEDGGRYAGTLTRDDVAGDHDPDRPAAELARSGPTIAPDAPASVGHALALQSGSMRVPVVDADGMLVGVVSVKPDRVGFCGT
jgi:CBS domain-containing protein